MSIPSHPVVPEILKILSNSIAMNLITHTERLTLRELIPGDAMHFFSLNADPEVLRYTGDEPFASVAAAETFLWNYPDYQRNGFGRWAVLDREAGEFLGWCGPKRNEEGLVDLGFRFYRKYWGKGYATEAARASVAYGFEQLGISEIIGRAAIDNRASIRVLEKVGMKFWKEDRCEGIERAVYYRVKRGEERE